MSQIKPIPEIRSDSNVVPLRRQEPPIPDWEPAKLDTDLEFVARQVLAELHESVAIQDRFEAFLAPALLKPHALKMETVRNRLAELVLVLEGEDRRDRTARVAKAVLSADLQRLSYLKHQRDVFIEV
ncbi:MAG: hypothetical protein AAGE61_13450 [Pseudomonadota bacterium]